MQEHLSRRLPSAEENRRRFLVTAEAITNQPDGGEMPGYRAMPSLPPSREICWGGRVVWLYAAHSAKLKAGARPAPRPCSACTAARTPASEWIR